MSYVWDQCSTKALDDVATAACDRDLKRSFELRLTCKSRRLDTSRMAHQAHSMLTSLGAHLMLGALLEDLRARGGGYRLVDHWQQGEFHHDTVLEVDRDKCQLPGRFLVVATNCNGGIKEVLCFNELPTHGGLWHMRCPTNPEFSGSLPPLLASTRTSHWFDPCELLTDNARSELCEEFRERQPGGGWTMRACGVTKRE